MPMLNSLASNFNAQFLPTTIALTASKAAFFAPGKPLKADFVYPSNTAYHAALTGYLTVMPGTVKETIRATIYYALTQTPPVGITFVWTTAPQFAASVAQNPPTRTGDGAITLFVQGPFPSEVPSIWQATHLGYDEAPSLKSAKRGSPRPAKRRPSRRSKKSSGRA